RAVYRRFGLAHSPNTHSKRQPAPSTVLDCRLSDPYANQSSRTAGVDRLRLRHVAVRQSRYRCPWSLRLVGYDTRLPCSNLSTSATSERLSTNATNGESSQRTSLYPWRGRIRRYD